MLAITVQTDTGPVHPRPADGEPSSLLGRFGGYDDPFATPERGLGEGQALTLIRRDGVVPFVAGVPDARTGGDRPVSPDEARWIAAGPPVRWVGDPERAVEAAEPDRRKRLLEGV
ncbi:hypothetical protein ACH4GP_25715 [Streptomyces celluloflavus]|uniref:Uncharacterized protein n=1 Tax=Streptomyces celluloflavus TaxID=58344 RepID=A0ABW7RJU6_9ACTN